MGWGRCRPSRAGRFEGKGRVQGQSLLRDPLSYIPKATSVSAQDKAGCLGDFWKWAEEQLGLLRTLRGRAVL